MERPLSTILILYGPLAVAAGCFLLALFVESDDNRVTIHLRPFGVDIFELDLPISNAVVVRIALTTVALLSLTILSFSDFSKFFPSRLSMEVFFDQAGIEESLKDFDQQEILQLGIPESYEHLQRRYFAALDEQSKSVLGFEVGFADARQHIFSSGETTFVVNTARGYQRYHIASSEGRLNHSIEQPGIPPLKFSTTFEKRNSRDDYFQGSVGKGLRGEGFMFRPLFKQIQAEGVTSIRTEFHHAVVGATKIYVYPFPRISNTVYLADFGEEGLVPVAYAVY